MARKKREIQRSTVNKTNKSRIILTNHFRVSGSDCKCVSTEMSGLAGPCCLRSAGDGQPCGEGWLAGCERAFPRNRAVLLLPPANYVKL